MKNVDRGPIVQTTAGRLWGIWESGLAVFRGIPYAAAPVGERRWRATESHPGWMGVREATVHGPIAPQPVGLPHDEVLGTQGRSTRFMDEDCLTLTLWSPGTDDARRPVLVWIHGGGMTTGAGSWDVYSCEEFARNGDLVAVSINYRLGPLGSLYAEEDGGGRGNFWIDDILAALCWVQDNIAAFGGDPANVTVAGQSGGALSIAYMMGSEAGRGLFRRAILQSMPLGFGARTIEESRATSERYFTALGVSTLQEARRLSTDQLLAPLGQLAQEASGWGLFVPPFAPVLDGRTIEQQVIDALALGRGTDVDLMLGWTREEDAFFHVPDPATRVASVEQIVERARLPFGDAAPQAYAEYARARPGGLPVEILGDITTDERYRMDGLRLADLRAAQERPAYVYQFDWQTRAFDGLLGAAHCLELPFTLHNFEAWSDARMLEGTDSPRRQALADAMHAAWIAFLRTGDPNHDALPIWEPYRLERRNALRFDTIIEPIDDVHGYWRRTWDRFGGRTR
jgi:carboxylesterase type B